MSLVLFLLAYAVLYGSFRKPSTLSSRIRQDGWTGSKPDVQYLEADYSPAATKKGDV
jgi:hypothetical protein